GAGTAHQAEDVGLGPYRSVSMTIAVVAPLPAAVAYASRNWAMSAGSSTSTPKLRILAARSTATLGPSSSPLCWSRIRYRVPKRRDPTDSDSAPIDAQPWF